MDVIDLYLFNLLITIAMFLVLIFRAWIELKNYKIMWEEANTRSELEAIKELIKAEEGLFSKIEGGPELYALLVKAFKIEED
ncbi:hypothetical protein AC482_00195 [miscellaneous Crenarchaeota group-15 archaeon DG-45]|uniref:Uncharacterized protein n=1 Tax=miscellaneous Crenarchaeota group-15 archaeon DG-45 TaxID=1685127 RepID=A0A0M0BTV0_9ARCH|nr:MAG: hypothetical protein AC482_00195 [miscellaneous Crenarchaeota group-15 archaeon DG-45]